MEIVVDDRRYNDASKAFLKGSVTSVVKALAGSGRVHLDPENITEDDITLVYDVCFAVFASIENHHPIMEYSKRNKTDAADAEAICEPVAYRQR